MSMQTEGNGKPVSVPSELFDPSPELIRQLDELAAWRLRSAIMMADQVFGPPG